MLRLYWFLFALPSLLLFTACSSPQEKPTTAESTAQTTTLRVAAAADLRYAMDSLVVVFATQQPNVHLDVTYGSSGKFYEQIRHGAPFELFFSADSDYPRQLQAQGLTAAAPVLYAQGQLVLWSKTLDPVSQGLQTLLDPRVKKIAIANPAHAPYGKKAVEILRHYQLYEKVQPRLVFGENIAQTANYAATGAADVGVLALALALSPALKAQGHYYLIPQQAYTPLEQSFVVLKGAAGHLAATQFSDFLASAPARTVLRAYGFTLPR
ncbi:molybdate ABC transporter substrate-binding protein [Hymenobacter sp. GOD-10R]|uniref:molybdate ABC transporter substrate-binding protein n=1 Tax=Hymenobacter sp. GOD-10R TaxID=3093922 RepID=UPI002D77FBF8|nr:molybdate ABC transporter substrate-binding protein [Hymenobacter sp. GOD-10R]WRQ27238.1 molybdate ABC transporter substrate-binding protein [Hymenobacter sp. GOD-10R]